MAQISIYVKAHADLRDHPKTWRLMDSLGVTKAEARGLLVGLWWWAMDYAQDGDLSAFTDKEIARACDWTGEADVLVSALVESGFADADPLRIHDWDQYGGKTLAEMFANRERAKRNRNKDSAPPTDTVREQYANATGTVSATYAAKSTEEKIREEKLRTGSDEPQNDPLRDEPPPLPTTERSLVGYYMRTLSDHYNLPAATERYRGQVAGAIKTLLRTDGLTTEQVCAAIEGYLTTTDPAWQASANNGKPPPGLIRFAREMYAGNGSQPPGVAA